MSWTEQIAQPVTMLAYKQESGQCFQPLTTKMMLLPQPSNVDKPIQRFHIFRPGKKETGKVARARLVARTLTTLQPHFLPSTIMIWYPNPVFTSTQLGLPVVLGSRSNAAFSNAGSRLPRVFQPREPPRYQRPGIVSPAFSSEGGNSKCTKRKHRFCTQRNNRCSRRYDALLLLLLLLLLVAIQRIQMSKIQDIRNRNKRSRTTVASTPFGGNEVQRNRYKN